ncbi:hypothetical protein ROSEINA2194_03289 [Roseburia inulinivorans DSM 16841]|uniref:Uncharacterized protein n=1 Tax=Roseburia inulinivorans DSM 16841 TaxID=622312 RepID=C0FX09_9FIRM|nr:hypothetical protein ROSEINA2194_03289 [Roseburia inulinivorans DSM 16841]
MHEKTIFIFHTKKSLSYTYFSVKIFMILIVFFCFLIVNFR